MGIQGIFPCVRRAGDRRAQMSRIHALIEDSTMRFTFVSNEEVTALAGVYCVGSSPEGGVLGRN